MKVVQVYTPEDCLSGLCDCASAKECKFPRCENCDSILDSAGKTLDDRRSYERCPDCGGPLDPH